MPTGAGGAVVEAMTDLPRRRVETPSGALSVIDLPRWLGTHLPHMPFVLRVLVENHIRAGGDRIAMEAALASWRGGTRPHHDLTLRPDRLLMHDTTCTPALVDVAAMRTALAGQGVDPRRLSPTLPVDVSVDHSLAVDAYGSPDALAHNSANEIARNKERYSFLKWASAALDGVRVHPPGTGIMHTLNMEQLAQVVWAGPDGTAHPELMLGTDSHTPMVNGLGVMAWGIGGLEAQCVMFGDPVSIAWPEVVGVRLEGRLPAGVLSTDLALHVTHHLRALGVAGRFVEFFGEGVSTLRADDRAVVANMAPEYGATTGYFPPDAESLSYLCRTEREALAPRAAPVLQAMGVWFSPADSPVYDDETIIDLSA
ncbi:MAG: aconitase family protein, partial [Pseudomonadota bacterium]